MTMQQTKDLRIIGTKEIQTPEALMQELPLSEQAANTVTEARQQIYDVLDGKDDRLVVIIGPCSIHDTEAAHEYADHACLFREATHYGWLERIDK
jgi:3-deoxy-7-phosphoheptulonate synthase